MRYFQTVNFGWSAGSRRLLTVFQPLENLPDQTPTERRVDAAVLLLQAVRRVEDLPKGRAEQSLETRVLHHQTQLLLIFDHLHQFHDVRVVLASSEEGLVSATYSALVDSDFFIDVK